MVEKPLIYLIAGEASGDAIGARLMAALREMSGGRAEFAGVGGPMMIDEGFDSLFPMEELSVMGLVEVLPHLRRILRRIRDVVADIERRRPAALVTIDAPSFSIRVARKVSYPNLAKIHYVAPTVWAWRPWRVHKFKACFDHLLAILPFEPPYFERVGLPCDFVGHPVIEYGIGGADGPGFRDRHGIAPTARVICVLPGSRRGEIQRLVSIFAEALCLLEERIGAIRVVVPSTPSMAAFVEARIGNWPGNPIVVAAGHEKYEAMQASNVALAASGTVALELALAGVPSVIAYRISPVTAFVVLRMLSVRYVHLLNIMADTDLVPEKLQMYCTPESLVEALQELFGEAGVTQIKAIQPGLASLGRDGEVPSKRAARVVLDVIDQMSV